VHEPGLQGAHPQELITKCPERGKPPYDQR